jgi:hypothetical protein
MKSISIMLALASTAALASAGEVHLFNGKDLKGWSGQSGFWSAEGGVITGKTTPEMAVRENTFLIWDGEVGDFELRFQYKIVDATGMTNGFGNSGVQYRSKIVKPEYSVLSGYQADFETGKKFSGILYEEKGRGILAMRGQKVVIHDGADPKAPMKPKIEVVGQIGKSDEIQAAIRPGDWNEYAIIAKGNHLQHFINGKLTVDVTDEGSVAAKTGTIGLQLHQGAPMTVQYKDMVLKTAD